MQSNTYRVRSVAANAAAGIAMFIGAMGAVVAAGPTSSFTLSGQVTNPTSYSLADLEAYPATTETVTYVAGGSPVTATFTGVLLYTLLTTNGQSLITNPAVKNDVLREYVVGTGSDGYKAVISLGEILPNFGGELDMIAYLQDGSPITTDGFARLVVPGDKFGGRYVSNLASLEVFNAAPVPEVGTLGLMLAGVSLMGWRLRKSLR
jgi:DMSO/TMAO reductase YedYZ molybdopterin-dependent catalytic subunit